jgi:hypothetical protein
MSFLAKAHEGYLNDQYINLLSLNEEYDLYLVPEFDTINTTFMDNAGSNLGLSSNQGSSSNIIKQYLHMLFYLVLTDQYVKIL